MTFEAYRYITLLSSLPHLAPPEQYERPPISRIQLEKRLEMLGAEDAALVGRLEALMVPDRLGAESDAWLLGEGRRLLESLESSCVKRWLAWWLALNVLTAALRLRSRGAATPGMLGEAPRLGHQLQRHWGHPTFRLEKRFPYMETLVDRVAEAEGQRLEDALLELGWRYFQRQRATRRYGLEEVLLYLFRWWLIERGCQRNPRLAQRRFMQLLAATPHLDSQPEPNP